MLKKTPILMALLAFIFAIVFSIWVREDDAVIILCTLLAVVVACVGGRFLVGNRDARTSGAWIAVLFSVGVPVFVAITDAPLKLAFWFVESRLETLANDVTIGNPPVTPFRAGIFVIKQVGVRGTPPVPFFLTSGDLGEINGFVRHPNGYGFNVWSSIRLNDNWAYIAED